MVTVGDAHRLYSLSEANRMMKTEGFEVIETAIWGHTEPHWKTSTEGMTYEDNKEGYLCMAVRKPC